MNKKEISELKKQFTPDNCTISRICGCYVDSEKEKRLEMRESFLSLSDEEMFKYFDIFKKTLSGTVGKNLLDMEFHSAIIKNSGSVQLHDILEKRLILLNSFYLTTAVVVIPTIESIERSYQEHAAILQAIRKNELNTAVKCLRFHLENAGEELLKNMKKRDRKLS